VAEPNKRVMVLVAHPDDPEFFCGGTIARWAREGMEITYVICTHGEKGTQNRTLTPERLAEIRVQEQMAAAHVLGVRNVVFLNYVDGDLERSLRLRGDMVREIRRYRPDIVITCDPTVRISRGKHPNHIDHRVAGDVALDAIFPAAGMPTYYPEQLVAGLEPHKVPEVYLTVTNEPDTWVDTTGTLDLRLAALRCHASQVADFALLEERIRANVDKREPVADVPRYAEEFRRLVLY
jgi:LmbE family N-acetylglucosaminyl deacetylase